MTYKQVILQGAFLSILCLSLFSCTHYKDVPYFQDVPYSDSDSVVYSKGIWRSITPYQSLKIRTGDMLSVSIQTITGNTSMATQTSSLEDENKQSNLTIGYEVDNLGEIDLPLVGKIEVKDLTIPEIKNKVRQLAGKFYKNPVINVRLVNFKVTVLGEVASPGVYIMSQEKATLLDALAMAGDMTIFGKRKTVLLTREIDGREKIVRFNLNSTKVLESPYFYLKQGDVVYIEPSKAKAFVNNSPAFQYFSLITSTVTLLSVLYFRFK